MHKTVAVSVLTVDEAPAVLATANLLAVDNNVLLRTNNGKGDDALVHISTGDNRDANPKCLP